MLSRQELKAAFDKADTDKSGAIDLNELGNVCKDLALFQENR